MIADEKLIQKCALALAEHVMIEQLKRPESIEALEKALGRTPSPNELAIAAYGGRDKAAALVRHEVIAVLKAAGFRIAEGFRPDDSPIRPPARSLDSENN